MNPSLPASTAPHARVAGVLDAAVIVAAVRLAGVRVISVHLPYLCLAAMREPWRVAALFVRLAGFLVAGTPYWCSLCPWLPCFGLRVLCSRFSLSWIVGLVMVQAYYG